MYNFKEVEILTGTTVPPAAEHLYNIRDECDQKKLYKRQVTAFHHAVAQLLSACPRARKDIQTALSFLTKRFWNLDEDYCIKLERLLRYVR